MKTDIDKLTLHLFKEGDVWVVRSEERDIAAQGSSSVDAIDSFADTLKMSIDIDVKNGREPLATYPRWDRIKSSYRKGYRQALADLRRNNSSDEVMEALAVTEQHLMVCTHGVNLTESCEKCNNMLESLK